MPVYGIPPSLPPDLPCVMLIEIDSATAKDTLDSSGAENHADVMYQIDVYSNLVEGRKEQCRAILEIVDNEMRRLGSGEHEGADSEPVRRIHLPQ